MTLRQKQSLFAGLLPLLMQYAYAMGYELTVGNTIAPTTFSGSLHPKKLAIDLNLFIDGEYQRSTKAHAKLGAFWKTLHPLCRWGGDFTPKDGNHYSLEHNGRR